MHKNSESESPTAQPASAIEQEKIEQEKIELVEALKVARHALLEFSLAQERGPGWYTKGASGMYQQVQHWLRKGLEAVRILERYE